MAIQIPFSVLRVCTKMHTTVSTHRFIFLISHVADRYLMVTLFVSDIDLSIDFIIWRNFFSALSFSLYKLPRFSSEAKRSCWQLTFPQGCCTLIFSCIFFFVSSTWFLLSGLPFCFCQPGKCILFPVSRLRAPLSLEKPSVLSSTLLYSCRIPLFTSLNTDCYTHCFPVCSLWGNGRAFHRSAPNACRIVPGG